MTLDALISQIKACHACAADLPCGPRPVIQAGNSAARLLIIGQAPGAKVHRTGIPWDDPSGDRLRLWLGLDKAQFYDEKNTALVGMGFCYPGKGKSGDLPPRRECAPLWHDKIFKYLPKVKLTLLIGQYAQEYYLGKRRKATLTETVQSWRDYIDQGYLPIVHPSPRNGIWLRRNPWFEKEVVVFLQKRIAELIS